MRRLIQLTALFSLAVLSGCGGKAVAEKSFEAPPGWSWETESSISMAVGPETLGIVPSLNVRSVEWDGAAEAWIDQNLNFNEQTFTVDTNFPTQVATREDFATDSALKGTKVVLINPRFSVPLKHTQYFFHTGTVMHILTYTRGLDPAKNAENWLLSNAMDGLADDAVKTFEPAPPPKL